ncbi:MAG: protein phosphatase 2C domain-containing protein [Pseudomonadota bacterium]
MSNIAGGASVGQRDNQEDAYKIVFQSEQDPHGDVLMMVADGMGGHVGGEIASNLALDAFEAHFISGSKSPRPRERLKESAFIANDALRARIDGQPELRGMGATLLCALKLHDRVVWASIGDSHLYLYRSRQLKKINADHSIYGELLESVAAGKITREEADAHPRKNALRSAVTGEDISLIDLNTAELAPGDTLVLASDGLDTVPQDQVAEVLEAAKRGGPEAQVQALLDAVAQVGKPTQDNTTIIIYRQGGDTALRAPTDSRWRLSNGSSKTGLSNPLALLGAAVAGVVLLGVLGIFMFGPSEPEAPLVTVAPLAEDNIRSIEGETIPEPDDETTPENEDADPQQPAEPLPAPPVNRNPIEESPYPAQRPDQPAPQEDDTQPSTPDAIPEDGTSPDDQRAEPDGDTEPDPIETTPIDPAPIEVAPTEPAAPVTPESTLPQVIE